MDEQEGEEEERQDPADIDNLHSKKRRRVGARPRISELIATWVKASDGA